MRKSSYKPGETPIRTPDDAGFAPTPAQRLARARFWRLYERDPSVEVSQLSVTDVVRITDCASIEAWWKQLPFREWFLKQDEWRDKLEASCSLWIDEVYVRLEQGLMTDKDLITAGKTLGEFAGKVPRVGDKRDSPPQLTEAQARAQFHEAALRLGYAPPAHLPAPKKDGED